MSTVDVKLAMSKYLVHPSRASTSVGSEIELTSSPENRPTQDYCVVLMRGGKVDVVEAQHD